MSAINIICRGATAHVLTDGAGYGPDGTLASVQQKVFPIAPLSMVLAVRGHLWLWPWLAAHVSEAHDTFDEVVTGFAKTYAAAMEKIPAEGRAALDSQPNEVYVVGISESRGAEAHVLVNHAAYGMEVGKLHQIDGGNFAMPADFEFMDSLPALGLDLASPSFDPARDGMRLMEAQRARVWPVTNSTARVRAVGGFAQLTTIEPGRISTRVLHRWPDRVGELIAA